MLSLDFPPPQFKLKKELNQEFIFDPIRKKWFVLTPEEWVRQNVLSYLMIIKNYPKQNIAVEKQIQVGSLKKRFDILVYDQFINPYLLVECKANHIQLDNDTLNQALIYHKNLAVKYIVITNGNNTWAWKKNLHQFILLYEIPDWKD